MMSRRFPRTNTRLDGERTAWNKVGTAEASARRTRVVNVEADAMTEAMHII